MGVIEDASSPPQHAQCCSAVTALRPPPISLYPPPSRPPPDLPVLQVVLAGSSLGAQEQRPRLGDATALVLLYELLVGQGFKPHGPAERALLACKVGCATRAGRCTDGRVRGEG